jgi:penicillin V acylase-like amidase (Ntn superfamily)
MRYQPAGPQRGAKAALDPRVGKNCKMKIVRFFILIMALFFVMPANTVYCCTIVMASRDGLILIGNNEDRDHMKTVVNYMPPEGNNHGAIMFGYDDAPFQGGMNDQGLFIDGNALAATGWKAESGKPEWRGNVYRKFPGLKATEKDAENFMKTILLTCATVKDVRDFVNKYNHPVLARAKFPVADQTGASIVIEFGQGRVQCIERADWYQISTNFVISNLTDGDYPCWRYRKADTMFREAKELNISLIRDILKATRQEEEGVYTVYSNIYDLKARTIYLYNRSNFDRVVKLNLREELKKGKRVVEIPSLFGSASLEEGQ